MTVLGVSELSSILDFAEQALAVASFDHVPPMLATLTRVVGADATTLTHLDLKNQQEVAAFWPPGRPQRLPMQRYARVGAAHPLRRCLVAPEGGGSATRVPLRISDVMGQREWRSTPIHCEVLTGVDDQMTLVLSRQGPAVQAVTLARGTGEFTDRQRELLGRCGPHLRAGVGRARRIGYQALQIAPVVQWVPALNAPGVADGRLRDQSTHGLSKRELEVLALVADGLTDAQVARRLGLRPATVSKHLSRIYTRLNVSNRAAAVRYWSRLQPS